jgi:hypothetical protein
MSKTVRQQIIEGFAAHFAAYGWQSASFAAVYVGRIVFDPDTDPLPLITILPRPDETASTLYGTDSNTMPMDVTAVLRLEAPDGVALTATDLGEPVKGELQAAAFAIPTALADLVERIEYRGGGIDDYPDTLGQSTFTVSLSLAVVYETKKGDPYSQ